MLTAFVVNADAIEVVFAGGVRKVSGGPITYTVKCGHNNNSICASITAGPDGGDVFINCNDSPICGHHYFSIAIDNSDYGSTVDSDGYTEVTLSSDLFPDL